MKIPETINKKSATTRNTGLKINLRSFYVTLLSITPLT